MPIPEHLQVRWPVLELIEAGKITWTEAETLLSINDVLDMHDVGDVFAQARELAERSR